MTASEPDFCCSDVKWEIACPWCHARLHFTGDSDGERGALATARRTHWCQDRYAAAVADRATLKIEARELKARVAELEDANKDLRAERDGARNEIAWLRSGAGQTETVPDGVVIPHDRLRNVLARTRLDSEVRREDDYILGFDAGSRSVAADFVLAMTGDDRIKMPAGLDERILAARAELEQETGG